MKLPRAAVARKWYVQSQCWRQYHQVVEDKAGYKGPLLLSSVPFVSISESPNDNFIQISETARKLRQKVVKWEDSALFVYF
jgi:hypothetical protein